MTSEAATEEDLDMTNSDNEASEDEQVRVEAWLDENPEFFQEYLIRKGISKVPNVIFKFSRIFSSNQSC